MAAKTKKRFQKFNFLPKGSAAQYIFTYICHSFWSILDFWTDSEIWRSAQSIGHFGKFKLPIMCWILSSKSQKYVQTYEKTLFPKLHLTIQFSLHRTVQSRKNDILQQFVVSIKNLNIAFLTKGEREIFFRPNISDY